MRASIIFHIYYLINPPLWPQSTIHPFPLTMPPHPMGHPHKWVFWVSSPVAGCHPCGHPPLLSWSLTWSHCASSSGPTLQCEASHPLWPTYWFRTVLSRKKGKTRGGKGQERERKGCVQFLTPTENDCSLSPQSTIFYSMFTVLRRLGVEGGIQRGMENMCSQKR